MTVVVCVCVCVCVSGAMVSQITNVTQLDRQMSGKTYQVSVTNVEELTLGFYLVSLPSYVRRKFEIMS